MLLLTGAAGKTGQAILSALASRGVDVRAVVHHPEQRRIARDLGAREAVVTDLEDRDDLDRAASGVRTIYHICPNVHPREIEIGKTAIEAGISNDVERFVYHSVLHPQLEAMPHHWRKLRVEEWLIQSGLPFSILQPAPYMQNLLAHRRQIVENGRLPLPYGATTRLALVDLADVAEAAAVVLTESGHLGGVYPLCGESGLSQNEAAEILSRRFGRPVTVSFVDRLAWAADARAAGLDEERLTALSAMFAFYDEHGLPGTTRILACLLGRRPTTFDQWVARLEV